MEWWVGPFTLGKVRWATWLCGPVAQARPLAKLSTVRINTVCQMRVEYPICSEMRVKICIVCFEVLRRTKGTLKVPLYRTIGCRFNKRKCVKCFEKRPKCPYCLCEDCGADIVDERLVLLYKSANTFIRDMQARAREENERQPRGA